MVSEALGEATVHLLIGINRLSNLQLLAEQRLQLVVADAELLEDVLGQYLSKRRGTENLILLGLQVLSIKTLVDFGPASLIVIVQEFYEVRVAALLD